MKLDRTGGRVCVFFFLVHRFIVSAIVIDPSMQFVVQNETYTVNATMVFDQIVISDTYIVFNDTGFYVTSPNSITIKLVYINDDIAGAVNGEKVLDFYATVVQWYGGVRSLWFSCEQRVSDPEERECSFDE